MASKKTHIRVPVELRDRLQRLADDMMAAHEDGRTTVDFVECTQPYVALHTVITRALDEYEDHKARSRKQPTRRQRKLQTA